jgi:hypothetical protein
LLQTIGPPQAGVLRQKIPRKGHGWWEAARNRANPTDSHRKLDEGRMKDPLRIRYGRMFQSPFAFYRGAAGAMRKPTDWSQSAGVRRSPAAPSD